MNAIKGHILKYLRGEIADNERAELEQWLAESPDNRAVFEEMMDADRVSTAMDKFSKMDEEGVWRRLQDGRRSEAPKTGSRWYWRAAILLLLAAGLGVWIRGTKEEGQLAAVQNRYKNDVGPGKNGATLTLAGGQTIQLDSNGTGTIGRQGGSRIINEQGRLRYDTTDEKTGDISYNTLSTGKGNQYRLLLPDGSQVWLNAASSITYPSSFSGRERRVTVTGEAYFEIAKNERAPFIVQRGNIAVQVLGTNFNINSYDDEDAVRMTLLEGRVRISDSIDSRLVNPGEQAILGHGGAKIAVDSHADIESVMAWKNETFRFNEATIEAVMRQMARWYDVQIEYRSRITQHFVADIPRNVPLSEVLKLLEMTDQVHFTIEGKKVTVSR